MLKRAVYDLETGVNWWLKENDQCTRHKAGWLSSCLRPLIL